MARARALLPYVTAFLDRHGKERHRFRRAGFQGGYFHHPVGSEEYLAEYHAFMSGQEAPKVVRAKVIPRSIDDLLLRYYGSNDFRGSAQMHTLHNRKAVLEAFRNGTVKGGARRGAMPVASATFDKMDRVIAKAAEKKPDGTGGPFAAQFLKKQLTRMFNYAVKLAWIPRNPMDFVSYSAPKTSGYHSITEDEIEQYRARHPLGTKARLAMEILLWTGKRRSDGRILGKQNYRDGMMWGRDQKTGKEWWLPIAPQLREAIDAMPPHDHLCFLVSALGKPYSAASLGNKFRLWFDQAGLPHCTAHGLRKAISRRMAEDLGMGNTGIKSVTLHSNDSEVAVYTAGADQKRLATAAIERLSEWETSNRAEKLDNHQAKRA